MKKLLLICFFITISLVSNAQKYDFIEKDLKRKSMTEMDGEIKIDGNTAFFFTLAKK